VVPRWGGGVLNGAGGVAWAAGPAAGPPVVAARAADGQLAGYHLLTATRADFLRRLGRLEEAAASYREALDMTATEPERRFLSRRLDEVTAGS
jgi:RNA polymerase sigma-70 factor (ECF subfamily)